MADNSVASLQINVIETSSVIYCWSSTATTGITMLAPSGSPKTLPCLCRLLWAFYIITSIFYKPFYYYVKKTFAYRKEQRNMVRISPWESCKSYFGQSTSILTVPCLYILDLLTVVTGCLYEYGKKPESKRLVLRSWI